MNVTIITDCRDENAKGRLVARTSSLFDCSVSFIGIKSEIEAAGNLIDTLDAYENQSGIILANVAPRNGKGKNFSNGTPFAYFWHKKVLVLTTLDGLTLSLIKKFKLVNNISKIDLEKSLVYLLQGKLIAKKDIKSIKNTQFRSFNFQPKAAKYLYLKKTLPAKPHSLSTIPDIPPCIWWIDNFGNCKTTLTQNDIPCKEAPCKVRTNLGNFKFYKRLKDVPNGQRAIMVGSSGLKEKRFLEIVVQGGSAVQSLKLKVGQKVKIM